MYKKLDDLIGGYHELTARNDETNMLMDIGIHVLEAGESITLHDSIQEMAILPLVAHVKLSWETESTSVQRQDIFTESPHCLHVCKNVKVTIEAIDRSEVLVQKTTNDVTFSSKLYTPEDCPNEDLGKGVWENTATRTIRTIFDYVTAPYSNLVIGEVISHPGRWSSYPPHHHDQPEVYYYRFDKEQGFGCAMVGPEAYRVENNSFITIPGGLDHPQATAPGYSMYFCWMIRHLENNPWTERIYEEEHKWLLTNS